MRYRLAFSLAAVVVFACLPASADVERGRAVYNARCYFCHGYAGDGRTRAATSLARPPRDFRALEPDAISRAEMIDTVRDGIAATPMVAFRGVLDAADIAAVVDFVRDEFMRRKAQNTRYHTAENGWPDHDRYRIAFPFATGEIGLDRNDESLTGDERLGRQFFLRYCTSCHDRDSATPAGAPWSSQSVSYPRNRAVADGTSSASTFAIHDRAPDIEPTSPKLRRGARLYGDNCAFCHAADGTGANWIGSFLAPKPRDFTAGFARVQDPAALARRIGDGVPDTPMPAWKHVLAADDIDAIAAYIIAAFGQPRASSPPFSAPVEEGQ